MRRSRASTWSAAATCSSTSNREAQQRALEIVHFALRPHGRLFLGVSETVDVGAHLFRAVDKKHRIYEPRLVRERRLPPVSGDGVLARSLALQAPPGVPPVGGDRPPGAPFLAQPAEPGGRSASARGASCT